MNHFWNGFEKRAGLLGAVENAAVKGEHGVLNYAKMNKIKAPAAAAPTLNYQAMKAPVSEVPLWKSRVAANAPKRVSASRQGWSDEMKQKIISGASGAQKPRPSLPQTPRMVA